MPFRYHIIGLGALLLLSTQSLFAQSPSDEGIEHKDLLERKPLISADTTSSLRLSIESLFFFKDNEYDMGITKGYTLPGVWLQPRLVYKPQPNIQLEVGLHALSYSGASKYPSYAFHDLPFWKGNQYQEGAHILPVFRANAQLGNFSITLGDISGGSYHELILPLYNPENMITADPEKGFQVRYSRPRYQLDSWVDWQSFIFERDNHQETFTAGLTQRIWLTKQDKRPFTLSLPIQFIAQHRGGEQDSPDHGVQTICNASIGLQGRWYLGSNKVNSLDVEAHRLWTYQQAGQLCPFDDGGAWWLSSSLRLFHSLRFQLGVFTADNFISLYGAPFFSTLSTKYDGGRFTNMTTGYWNIEYSKTLGKYISVGANLTGYLSQAGAMTMPSGEIQPPQSKHAFAMGIYLRANPTFLIKLFK